MEIALVAEKAIADGEKIARKMPISFIFPDSIFSTFRLSKANKKPMPS
ncbi:MAG: hypothetical protein LKJ88_06950 [Bacilli bacterium]|jgi:hypothetical protein|nr:hypothetical protein [Bacilli bacterium]